MLKIKCGGRDVTLKLVKSLNLQASQPLKVAEQGFTRISPSELNDQGALCL